MGTHDGMSFETVIVSVAYIQQRFSLRGSFDRLFNLKVYPNRFEPVHHVQINETRSHQFAVGVFRNGQAAVEVVIYMFDLRQNTMRGKNKTM